MPVAAPPRPAFKKHDKLLHRFNPDLGPGRVEAVDGRRITVSFPKSGARLVLAADDHALKPLVMPPGLKARLVAKKEEVRIAERLAEGEPEAEARYLLADGRVVADHELWPLEMPETPLEKLGALETDRAAAFRTRLAGLLLQKTRQAQGLGSFLGGRIGIFPHQLYVAERATAADPVRWLLADEVGLGKTVEACLILSRLLRAERADRTLVVAPSTLTVQWLGELWRKFHQTFVLLDKARRKDVAKDHGKSFNVFEAHRRSVVALEDLASDPKLAAQAAEAGLDLLVVDEAHRLELTKEGGNAEYRALAPIADRAEHVLLLSATPLEADTHGFFGLLSLARPDAYRSEKEFLASLADGKPLPPCTSATRRVDIGGLPPRVPLPVELPASPAQAGLTGDEMADAHDPRVRWLVDVAPRWQRGGEEEGKALVFCHDLATLTALKTRLEFSTRRRVAIFHEELTPERRDMEVAEFRRAEGPTFLLSTECGGEGRNFEFCRRLVLFDLPTDPAQVEQRIGRLDRINRKIPVEIVYFQPPDGFARDLVRLYEEIGLFREPLGGLERSLAHVEEAIVKAERLARVGRSLDFDDLVREVRAAAKARQEAVYHHLHADAYRAELADSILSRVPPGLDKDMEEFVVGACHLYGFDTSHRPAQKTWYVEFGTDALVEHLPGVPGGTRYLGTFEREEALAHEELEFFASGHPLVEGIFQELEDGPRGRAALLRLEGAGVEGNGLLFLHRAPDGFVATAVDLVGHPRPEWAELLLARRADLHGLSPDDWFGAFKGKAADRTYWPKVCQALAQRVPDRLHRTSRLLAVAAFRLTK